jgi:hypothetical protein
LRDLLRIASKFEDAGIISFQNFSPICPTYMSLILEIQLRQQKWVQKCDPRMRNPGLGAPRVRNASQAVRLHFPDPPRASAHQSKREKQILHTKEQLYCVFGGILLHNSPKISDPGRYHGQSDPIILYSWSAAPPDPTQSQRATKRLPCGSGSTEMRVSGSSSPHLSTF